MKYKIATFPAANYSGNMERVRLNIEAETVAEFDAPSATKAREMAEPVIASTRSQTTWARKRGKLVESTVFVPCDEAIVAWKTARGMMALVKT